MAFSLVETVEILRRTPVVLSSLLSHAPESWVRQNEGPGTWSAFDIVGHLVHGEETDWVPRARIILTAGPSRPFDSFDRFAQLDRFQNASLEFLLDLFARLRQANLETVESWHLTESQLALPGLHPELGPVTLEQLMATWVVHDLGHLNQVSRVMAKNYRQEVGPWRAYLPVLTR